MDNTMTINNVTMLYTVNEVAKIMHTNAAYVYKLIKSQRLVAIKLGSYKIRRETLDNFFATNEGYDLTDPYNVKPYEIEGGDCE